MLSYLLEWNIHRLFTLLKLRLDRPIFVYKPERRVSVSVYAADNRYLQYFLLSYLLDLLLIKYILYCVQAFQARKLAKFLIHREMVISCAGL